MKKTLLVMTMVIALSMSMVGAAIASSTMLASFTQTELNDNWEADRQFPTGDVASVAAFGRTEVAQLALDSEQTATGTFQRTEGIKTVGDQDFGHAVQVDLYSDPDWEGKAVRAGLWVVGDDGDNGTTGTGSRDNWFGIIEFVNLEPSTSGDSAQGDHEGWRIWDSAIGWINIPAAFTYGDWTTLTIALDTDNKEYSYTIDGVEVGTAAGGENFIREVFINSYNYGLDAFTNLSNESYAAHWHVGLEEIDSKDQCKDGSWEAAGFKNQGQCVRFVNTGQDSR